MANFEWNRAVKDSGTGSGGPVRGFITRPADRDLTLTVDGLVGHRMIRWSHSSSRCGRWLCALVPSGGGGGTGSVSFALPVPRRVCRSVHVASFTLATAAAAATSTIFHRTLPNLTDGDDDGQTNRAGAESTWPAVRALVLSFVACLDSLLP